MVLNASKDPIDLLVSISHHENILVPYAIYEFFMDECIRIIQNYYTGEGSLPFYETSRKHMVRQAENGSCLWDIDMSIVSYKIADLKVS